VGLSKKRNSCSTCLFFAPPLTERFNERTSAKQMLPNAGVIIGVHIFSGSRFQRMNPQRCGTKPVAA
jgi:hypothetical protein